LASPGLSGAGVANAAHPWTGRWAPQERKTCLSEVRGV